MNSKNTGKSRNRRFQPIGLIFYCYLLIPLNELARNALIINKIKNIKKIIDISMVSIGNAGKRVFCHLDERRDLVKAWLRMIKSDLSQAQDDNRRSKSPLIRVSFFDQIMPKNNQNRGILALLFNCSSLVILLLFSMLNMAYNIEYQIYMLFSQKLSVFKRLFNGLG